MSTNEMEVSVVYDASDLRSLYSACRKCRQTLYFVSALPLILLIYDLLNGTRGVDLILSAVVHLILALAVFFGFYSVAPHVQLRNRERLGHNVPMQIRMTSDSIFTRLPSQASEFHWHAIKNVVERGDRIFIFTSPGCAIILPRHSFQSDADFRAWVSQAKLWWSIVNPVQSSK